MGKDIVELLKFVENGDFIYISEQYFVSFSKQKVKPGVQCKRIF